MKTQTEKALDTLRSVCTANSIQIISSDSDAISSGKTLFRCLIDSSEWPTNYKNITRTDSKASRCPTCAVFKRKQLLLERGEWAFTNLLESEGYSSLDVYAGTFDKIRLKCSNTDHAAFSVSPTNFKAGQRCPTCTGHRQHFKSNGTLPEGYLDSSWNIQYADDRSLVILNCRVCGTDKTINLTRRNEFVECDCQKYGKRLQAYIESNAPDYTLIGTYTKSKNPVTVRHNTCGTDWEVSPYNFTAPSPTRCPKCARTDRTSEGQKEVASFIRDELQIEIEENVCGLYKKNPRFEVDIFVKSKSIAIEFDGVWWHAEGPARESSGPARTDSARGKTLDRALDLYHSSKIRTIRIFSDEWMLRKDAVKSRLRSILGASKERVGARKLQLDISVSREEATEFAKVNHVQGSLWVANTVALGLRDSHGILISLMTFGVRSLGGSNNGVQLELLRFCSLNGWSVPGAASRLLKAFLDNFDLADQTLVTFADVRWSGVDGGKVYEKLGFTKDGHLRPSYSYVHSSQSNRRVSRLAMQKHKLLEKNVVFTPDMTEWEMATTLGYARIWDSGQLRFSMKL